MSSPIPLLLCSALLMHVVCAAGVAQEAVFIGDFLQQQDEWPKLAEEGTLLRIEGRIVAAYALNLNRAWSGLTSCCSGKASRCWPRRSD